MFFTPELVGAVWWLVISPRFHPVAVGFFFASPGTCRCPSQALPCTMPCRCRFRWRVLERSSKYQCRCRPKRWWSTRCFELRLGRLGEVGGWGGDFGLTKSRVDKAWPFLKVWKKCEWSLCFLSLSRAMNRAASNFFTGVFFLTSKKPIHNTALTGFSIPRKLFTSTKDCTNFASHAYYQWFCWDDSKQSSQEVAGHGMEQGHVFSEDAFWTWKSIITIYRVISRMSPYVSKGGVMFLPGKLVWQKKTS